MIFCIIAIALVAIAFVVGDGVRKEALFAKTRLQAYSIYVVALAAITLFLGLAGVLAALGIRGYIGNDHARSVLFYSGAVAAFALGVGVVAGLLALALDDFAERRLERKFERKARAARQEQAPQSDSDWDVRWDGFVPAPDAAS